MVAFMQEHEVEAFGEGFESSKAVLLVGATR
jgi:hypothetical protein